MKKEIFLYNDAEDLRGGFAIFVRIIGLVLKFLFGVCCDYTYTKQDTTKNFNTR